MPLLFDSVPDEQPERRASAGPAAPGVVCRPSSATSSGTKLGTTVKGRPSLAQSLPSTATARLTGRYMSTARVSAGAKRPSCPSVMAMPRAVP